MPSQEWKFRPMPRGFDHDMNTAERLLTPEVIKQPGARIANRFLDALGLLPRGQWSSVDPVDPTGLTDGEIREKNRERFRRDRTIAEGLTNHSGIEFRKDGVSFFSRDPRHFWPGGIPQETLDAIDHNLAEIFYNEYEHQRTRTKAGKLMPNDAGTRPFVYIRLPGGIDCVLKGYNHDADWQRAHGEYLRKTAKNAQVLVVEGYVDAKYGDSSYINWSADAGGHYDSLISDAVSGGFRGLFTEVDMRDDTKFTTDSTSELKYPQLPPEFYTKYYNYLKRYFPLDASKIKNEQQLKKILMLQSTSFDGSQEYDIPDVYEDISLHSPAYVNGEGSITREMTGLEFGDRNASDAMAALKLHLIAKEMREGRIKKGIIVDFEGANHLAAKYFYLLNLDIAAMTTLKNPHFILKEQLAVKNDISSIYPAFSPDAEMFRKMLEQTWKLETERVRDNKGVVRVWPRILRSPMYRYEIPGRREEFEKIAAKADVSDLVVK